MDGPLRCSDHEIKTGWPPGLLQDDDKKFSKWLSNKLGARRVVRDTLEPTEEEIDSVLKFGKARPIYPKMADGCCHKTVIQRCTDCSFNVSPCNKP
jgi:hypothetical protein